MDSEWLYLIIPHVLNIYDNMRPILGVDNHNFKPCDAREVRDDPFLKMVHI